MMDNVSSFNWDAFYLPQLLKKKKSIARNELFMLKSKLDKTLGDYVTRIKSFYGIQMTITTIWDKWNLDLIRVVT